MPIKPGDAPTGRGFGNTNGTERKRICSDVIAKITQASTVQLNDNDIGKLARKTGFHIDSIELLDGDHSGHYKVDIQRARPPKDTVAQVLVHPDVTDAAEIRAGLEASLREGTKYIVTPN